jgi:molybdate transport system substrate-binding protein
MIAPRDSQIEVKLVPGFKLSNLLGNDRLSIADPASVPAGKYARSALQTLSMWSDIEHKLVAAENVRAALNYVALGEAPLGIVYKTDALLDKRVRIVGEFDEQTHSRILYPVALTPTASSAATKFLSYMRSSPAQAVFLRYGFKTLH